MSVTTEGLAPDIPAVEVASGGVTVLASLRSAVPVQAWSPTGDGLEPLGVVGGLLLLVGLLGAVVLLTHRNDSEDGSPETDGGTSRLDGVPTSRLDGDPLDRALDASAEDVTTAGGRFSREAFTNTTGMSPETFVYRFVEDNGGQVKQQRLLACFPWSKATVSRYLTELEEEGLVQRVRTGRENYVETVD